MKLLLVIAFTCLLATTGCTSGPPLPDKPGVTVPPLWHPKQPRPADRDEKTVDAALAKVDLCGLLDMSVFERRRAPGSLPAAKEPSVHDGRRWCELTRTETVETVMGVEDASDARVALMRYDGLVVDLGGVKGYRIENHYGGALVQCSVLVPVSFERALEFASENRQRPDNAQCDIALDFANAGVKALPPGMTYAKDAQDGDAVGACVDEAWVDNGKDCDPAVDVPVPANPEQILVSAARDPNVECAVFRDAVRGAFGAAFRALATRPFCLFVEPSHRTQIEVEVDPIDDPPGVYGSDPTLWKDKVTGRSGGQPSVRFRTLQDNEFSVYASPHGDLGTVGHVSIRLRAAPGRGIDTTDHQQLSKEDAARAEGVENYVMARYFPRTR